MPASSAAPLLRVARLRANVSLSSLFRRAPVVEALDIDAPQISVARLSAGHYDVDDLIDKFTPRADQPAGQPARFALYNLQVRDGQLRFDDRPAARVHVVEALNLALPFLSDLPAQVQVTVEPHLAFKLNGASFDSGAQATPFAPTRHAALKLTMANLDVAPYLGYLPASLPVRLTRGALSADLSLEFTQPSNAAPSVSLRGWAGARDLALGHVDGTPLLSWRQLRIGLRDVQPLARRLAFDTLRIEGAQLHVARDAAGRIDALPAPAPAASAASAAPATAAAAPPWQISLNAIELADARVLWNDSAVQPAAALQLDDVSLVAKQVQWPMALPTPLTLAATLRTQAEKAEAAGRFTAEGSASDHEAKLNFGVADLALNALAPYLAQALTPPVEGRLSAQAALDWSADAQRLQVAVPQATLDALRVQPGSGRTPQPGAALEQLALADMQLDVLARTATLASVKLVQPSLLLNRDSAGRLNVVQWMRTSSAGHGAADAHRAAAAPASPWHVQVHSFTLDDGRVQLTDAFVQHETRERPLRAELNHLQLAVQDFAWFGDKAVPAAKLQLSARVAGPAASREETTRPGQLDWKGEFGLHPMLATGNVRIVRFPAHLPAAYVADLLPVSLLRAEAGYSGRISVREQAAG